MNIDSVISQDIPERKKESRVIEIPYDGQIITYSAQKVKVYAIKERTVLPDEMKTSTWHG